ncbi:MAG: insulinase family protein [bacterium]|nr:insulinase family protein [bacterium]
MDIDSYPAGRLAPCTLADGLYTGRTPGGLRVVVRRDARSPVAVCNIWVGVGSNREPDALRGWSHGIEHMLFKGTERRGERDFALEVAAAGGSTNAGTGYETTNYHITVPADRLPVAIDILGDALLHSRFEEASLAAERQVLVHENHMYDDIPFGFGVTWRWGLELAFDRSPYRHPIGGRDENLLTCPRSSILAYWRSAYRPSNMVAVVVGDVDPQGVFAQVAATFDSLAGRTEPATDDPVALVAAPPLEPRRDGPRLRIERGELTRAYAKFVFPAPGEDSGLDPVLAVCQRVLNDGRSCRLYRKLQEELKLVDEYAVMTETGPREGVVLVDLETSVDRLAAAVRACARILGELSCAPEAGGCEAGELARAARRTARSHLFGLETVQGQASSIGHHALAGDLAGAFDFPARVAAVTAADVAAYAAEVFRPGNLALVVYVPRDTDLALNGLPTDADGLSALLADVLPEPAPVAWNTPGTGGRAAAPHAPAAARNPAPAAAAFTSSRLSDGSSFHCRTDAAVPVIALAVAVRGGAAGESATQAGLGALAHQALLRGAAGRSAADFSLLIEDDGAALSPVVDRDYGGLFLTALADRLEPALDRLADAILAPDFAPEEIEQERRLAREQLDAIADNPLQTAMLRLRELLYGDHPYGRPLPGTADSLAAITRGQVVARHRAAWCAGRLQFTASGDLEPERLRDACERLVARLPIAAALPAAPGPALRSVGPVHERLTRAQNQSVVLLGWPGPATEDADRLPLQMLRQVMGGQSGRLFEQLRNRRSLCYNAGLVTTAGFGQGAVIGYVLTAPATADQAREALLTELLQVAAAPVPRDEWERARTELLGTLLIGSQANTARVARAQRDVMYGRDANDHAELVERIRSCEPAQMCEAAARYLRADGAVAVTLGPV